MTWSESSWRARVTRARDLSRRHPAASEALDFYAVVASTQEQIFERYAAAVSAGASFRDSLDVDAAARACPELLSTVSRVAPAALAEPAAELQRAGYDAWRRLLRDYWGSGSHAEAPRAFLAEALLQPFAEGIARLRRPARRDAPTGAADMGRCPVCAGRPVVAMLRESGQSAKRFLQCGFCLTEWPAMRAACAACGETTFEQLPIYSADEFPGVRVDCCETCRAYLKTFDLSRDATAVPVVDDLATVALDLWARGQGYERIRPNLLRL